MELHLIRPVTKAVHILVVGAALVLGAIGISVMSMPFAGLDALTLLFLLSLPVAVAWGVSVILAAAARQIRPLLIAPLLIIAVVGVGLSGVPRAIRVALSDAALTQTVRAIEAGDLRILDYDEYEPIFWAGHVPIYGVENRPGDTHLVAGFTGSDTPAGLVQLPSGPPTDRPPGSRAIFLETRYEYVYGSWYRWWYY